MYQVRLKGTHPGCIAGVYFRGGLKVPAWQPQTADGRNQPQQRGEVPALMVADEDMNDEILNDPWLDVMEVSDAKAKETRRKDRSDEGQDKSQHGKGEDASGATGEDESVTGTEVGSSAGGTKASGAGAKTSGTRSRKKG